MDTGRHLRGICCLWVARKSAGYGQGYWIGSECACGDTHRLEFFDTDKRSGFFSSGSYYLQPTVKMAAGKGF